MSASSQVPGQKFLGFAQLDHEMFVPTNIKQKKLRFIRKEHNSFFPVLRIDGRLKKEALPDYLLHQLLRNSI